MSKRFGLQAVSDW